MLSFLAGARLHRKCADSIAHQLNEENEQAARSEAKAKKMDTVIKYCNFIGSVLFLLALASTVYLSLKLYQTAMTERPINNRQTEKSNKELIANSDRKSVHLRPISMDKMKLPSSLCPKELPKNKPRQEK